MYISLTLLVLFIGSTYAKKQGDFGIFTACFTDKLNKSLRLDCYYAKCPESPSFSCEFIAPNGSLLDKASNEKCKHVLPGDHLQYAQTTMNCTLKRNKREEKLQLTIDYGAQGQKGIKVCRGTTGLLLHRAPTLLCPVMTLSLWTVLITDSQTT